MMFWRKRVRPMECDLGPVRGEPLPPMRPPPKRERYNSWMHRGVGVVIGVVGVIVWVGLIVVFFLTVVGVVRTNGD